VGGAETNVEFRRGIVFIGYWFLRIWVFGLCSGEIMIKRKIFRGCGWSVVFSIAKLCKRESFHKLNHGFSDLGFRVIMKVR
jgi:hypothetical protein